ncbi:MAG: TonB-dependent receptor, partial [Azovibrio sp.]
MQKKVICVALAWVFSQSASAAEPRNVNAELAELRAQVNQMKQAYEARIAALEDRLESASASANASPQAIEAPVVSVSSNSSSGASAFNPEVSLILQGAYKQRKKVPERQITGFWNAGGHDHGEEKRGFSLDHTELVLAANIDSNFRGQATLALVDDEVEVEEAWFQALGLGHGVGIKAGRFFSGVGYLNEQHPHQWDFYDQPLMYKALFGEHSYTQDGIQAKWVAPTRMFISLGAELGRGQNFP